MPPTRVTARARAYEFRDDGFHVVDNTVLMCKFCNVRLVYVRKDTLIKHCAGEKHRRLKAQSSSAAAAASSTRQQSIAESLATADSASQRREKFIVDTTRAFVSLNISVGKLDAPAMKLWMDTYVPGAGDLPSSSTLRRRYIPMVAQEKKEDTKRVVKDIEVAVLADETTDKGGRCVFNIMLKTIKPTSEQELKLVASAVLDSATGASCSNAICETLAQYDVTFDNVCCFVSDSANYMTTCARTLQGHSDFNIIHVQCWAHKISLCGDYFQENLNELNTAITKIKNAFLNARKRKTNYIKFLEEKYPNDPAKVTQFPMPVVTRWNSWFKAAFYVSTHLDEIVEFLKSLDENNGGVLFFRKCSTADIGIVRCQALFVTTNCKSLVNLLVYLEGSSYPQAHVLCDRLDDLEVGFATVLRGLTHDEVPEQLRAQLVLLNARAKASVVDVLKSATLAAVNKLKSLRQKDPAKMIFICVNALLSPRKLSVWLKSLNEIKKYTSEIPFFRNISDHDLQVGYEILRNQVIAEMGKAEVKDMDLVNILCSLKPDHLQFASACLKSLWIPTNNVDCERSLSKYSIVVSDRRRRLLPENAEALTILAFDNY